MSALVTKAARSVAAREPSESRALGRALYLAEHCPRDATVTPAVRREAATALAYWDGLAAPMGDGPTLRWLASLNLLVGNTLPRQEFDVKGRLLAAALQGWPGASFTDRAMRSLAKEHFPGLATIEDALRPEKEAIDRRRRALAAVRDAKGEPPPRPAPVGLYTAPAWVDSRRLRPPSGDTSHRKGAPSSFSSLVGLDAPERPSGAHAPVRTVAQQLAILRGEPVP